jgi:hypothetical protein
MNTTKINRTARCQALTRAIRALDANADLDGITHNVAELEALLAFIIEDSE